MKVVFDEKFFLMKVVFDELVLCFSRVSDYCLLSSDMACDILIKLEDGSFSELQCICDVGCHVIARTI